MLMPLRDRKVDSMVGLIDAIDGSPSESYILCGLIGELSNYVAEDKFVAAVAKAAGEFRKYEEAKSNEH